MDTAGKITLVIFGATGDLTYRKLGPAIYALKRQRLLPERFNVIGIGRKSLSDDDFRSRIREGINLFTDKSELDNGIIDELLKKFSYLQIDMDSASGYKELKSMVEFKENIDRGNHNYIFYMATPPDLFFVIPGRLKDSGLMEEKGGFRRVIFEKPFGTDYNSCRRLNDYLHKILSEKQIYRIDHYLGKETVQNILVMRFSNGLFEPLWNRNYIHHIQITSAENLGVENRGGYYDSAGALRDMVQNHLLQIVGLTAMEPPSSLHPDAIRNEVLKVFQSLQPLKEAEVPEYVIRGQYTASKVMGECIPAYREEPGVNPASRTETFVAMKFFINNWRWGGVPFFIRTGKRLPTRVTEIVVNFKPTPHFLFHVDDMNKAINQLIIRIQPDEGIVLKFGIKKPGSGFNVENVSMDFHYSDLLKVRVPEAYERLLGDVIMGDSTLFARDDVVEAAWKFLEPVQKAWAENRDIKIYGYPAGTWGPEEAGKIIGDGLEWRYPCKNLADDGTFCEL
ncbi:MAG: glucose-6-phosphate dehydrogenase [Bacteroidales bacterium]